MIQFNLKYFSILILLVSLAGYAQVGSPVPENSKQMILIIVGSTTSTSGNLICYERENANEKWIRTGDTLPVVIGRNGLGWGRGLHKSDSLKLPFKTEGDGRSPAGVFNLSSAFGYADEKEMKDLKIPYIHITRTTECIDDVKSSHYNEIVSFDKIGKAGWQSSERMYYAEIYYEQGVVIDHNTNPVVKGAGSCIFLHNWSSPDETTSGCTEMEPLNMKKIICWLDASAKPVIVQLTKELYYEYRKAWELP